ncbi:MOSC domain-containing protein [Streptomyces sp. AC512_CC834]|uniref:MOSC domain-containing protein n=1 Tax=Streptomyces sp. AC512_CC834 TaxID=2823691 RepID=UPI001C2788C8|nr:MOSC N-terminal beta barrel domain-containing protein [Streptomyces sp. AC512_CC834]
MARVVELTYYPVKGCAGVQVREAMLTPAGLAHDRSFMVVSDQGVFRTQRRDPRLAVIRPEVRADGGLLTLHARTRTRTRTHEGDSRIDVEVDTTGARRTVDLFGTAYRGIDQGDAVAEWLSDFLGAPSRLVRVPPEHERVTDGRTPGTSGYADSSAVHLLSRATLDELGRRLAGRGETPLPANRFRPNIVVDGWDAPHTEDRAHHLVLGAAELGYAKLAVRCAVTMVEQSSGTRAGPEPLRTLADYRRAAQGGIAFGAKFSVLRPGPIRVGDGVSVGRWGESELPPVPPVPPVPPGPSRAREESRGG